LTTFTVRHNLVTYKYCKDVISGALSNKLWRARITTAGHCDHRHHVVWVFRF